MPTVKLGSLSKRKNSTYVPTSTELAAFTEFSVTFKKPTSVRNPVFELATNIPLFDYAYVPDFLRYYFVSDVISLHNGLMEVHLEEDVMATHKSNIGATMARIAYASTGYNVLYPDQRIAAETDKQITAVSVGETEFSSVGCYILTTFNGSTQATNGLGTAYVMSEGNIQKVHTALGNQTVWQSIQAFFTGTPMEAIFGCIWVPFKQSQAPATSTSSVWVGDQDLSNQVTFDETSIMAGTGIKEFGPYYLTIQHRYNDFRDYEPYTTAQIYLPGIGCTDINLSDFQGATKIAIRCIVEYGTGDVTYFLSPDTVNSQIVQTLTVNLASQCPLGQTTINGGGVLGGTSGIIGGLGTAIAGVATENWAMAGAGIGAAIISSANTALQANKRGTSIKGGAGGRSSTYETGIYLIHFSQDTEDPDDAGYIATKGRPVCKTALLSGYSGGFVQCDDASVIGAMESWERDEINNYLNSGFYYN